MVIYYTRVNITFMKKILLKVAILVRRLVKRFLKKQKPKPLVISNTQVIPSKKKVPVRKKKNTPTEIRFDSKNKYVNLHLPENYESINVAILGNTIGFFGVIENNMVSIFNTNADVVNKTFFWLYKFLTCTNNTLYIIGDKDIIQYYKVVLNDLYNTATKELTKKVKYINIDTFAKRHKLQPKKRNTLYVNVLENLEEKGMRFNYILMNPPYDRNLHLKILNRARTLLKDTDSYCVSLSPIRWLEDPAAKYKDNSDYHRYSTLRERLVSVESITAKEAQLLFNGTVMGADLGILYVKNIISENAVNIISPLIERLTKFNQSSHPTFDMDKKDGWRVRIPVIISGRSGGDGVNRKVKPRDYGKLIAFYNGMKDNKPWYEFFGKNQHSKTTDTITRSIKFDSEECANNFIKTFDLSLIKFYMDSVLVDTHIYENLTMWLGNIENPRTHKKGYNSDWTDEDLCKVLDISGFISETEAEPDSEWEKVISTVN